MSERDERGRPPAEGVRIIGAEEAQAALEAGEAAGRRPEDALRFGDVPPAPAGPRPAHRFPLPESLDPAEAVSLPPARPTIDAPRASDLAGADQDDLARADDRATGDWRAIAPAEPSGGGNLDYDDSWPEVPSSPPPSQRGRWGWGQRGRASRGPSGPDVVEGPDSDTAPGSRAEDVSSQSRAPFTTASPEDRTTELGVPAAAHLTPEPARPVPDEGITVTGSAPEMPHWTDPPTGEVPRLRFDEDADEGEDDLDAWRSLGNRGVRWRDEDDWHDADDVADLVGDVEPMGALDQTRADHSDIYSFDEDFERVASNRTGGHPVVDLGEGPNHGDDDGRDPYGPDADPYDNDFEEVVPRSSRAERGARARRGSPAAGAAARRAASVASRSRARVSGSARRVAAVGGAGASAGASPDSGSRDRPGAPVGGRSATSGGAASGGRVAVGVVLIVLLAVAYAIGPAALVVLSVLVIVASAAEAYQMMRQAGFQPATLLGLVATVGALLGSYWRGIEAVPITAALLFAGAMLWYLLGIVEARPLANMAVTVMVFVWVGLLGSFAGVLLHMYRGKGLFLGAVLTVVAADIGAFFVGRLIGSRPMAAQISPNKTIEGFIGGLVAALIVGAIIGRAVSPWGGMKHGLVLGLVIGLVAPAGDLFESLIKRDLGVKDSGRVLAGHGGLLDRFDALLLALPVAYFVATFFRV